ncbi:MAG: thioredoxin family protein [Opitutaceae bacterium]|nr:thioredoxin family protein [Opitutaceae bacterium]
MRRLTLFLGGIAALVPDLLSAVQVGDSHDDVIAALGRPAGHMGAGATQVLTYPQQVIRLTDGKVVSIKTTPPAALSTPRPSPAATPAAAAKPAPSRPVHAPPLVWQTEVQAAQQQAFLEQKQVFLFFTGSDWCSWCKKFDGEILETPAFRAYAAQRLVLVKLDFPRTFKLPERQVVQNRALARKHRVDGYPTVVVLNPDGKTLGSLGYQPGGPEPFVMAMMELESGGAK